ncbi:MAG: S9 family peptidase [Gammaproteobacteria bacterium]|nr:S9 family peptidase [Gammaproteobacteria bacterium]
MTAPRSLYLAALLLPSLGVADGRPLTIDDVLSLSSVSSPQLSPDGQWAAYTVTARDFEDDKRVTRVWMVSTDGGVPIPMTSPDYSASNPRWSPDNRYLSFSASKGEDAKSQVWNLNRLGGEAIQVTDVKQGVSGFEWSPDGTRLLLTIKDPLPSDLTEDKDDDDKPMPHVIDRMQFKQDYVGYLDRRRSHIYVYTPGEEAPVQVTFGDYDDSDAIWSPDSKTIAFVSDRSDDPDLHYGTDIWTVEVDEPDHPLTQVTTNEGRDFSPAWSPDGRSIAYVTSTGYDVGGSALTPTRFLAITRVGRDERRILTAELDRNVSNPEFSTDGSKVFFELEDSGQVHFASVGADGRGLSRELERQVDVGGFAMAGGRTVLLVGRPDHPAELYRFDDGSLDQLTDAASKVLDGVARASVEKRRFDSADGTSVEAFFYRPADFDDSRRYPTILWLHGGPAAQFTYDYSETGQLFAANGYVVIMPNPRGSVGYGQEFAQGTVAAWGEKDFADAMAAVDHGIEIGIVDPERMGVGGWSYGGILTNFVITQTDRFKAAMSGASLGLTTANYGHDHYQLMYELEFGLPWENPERWTRLSPFSKVENITTPTLWMGGALDWNVPIINSEQMYIAMKRLGRDTQLVVYPEEHHGIRRPSFEKDRLERWLAWFDERLKGEAVAADTADSQGAMQ